MTKTAKRILIAAMSVLFVFAVAVFASACEFLTDPAYTVTVDYDETKGTVTLSPAKDDYILGDQVTVTVEANEGVFVQSFEVNGFAAELTGGRYSFRVEGNTAIAVEFADAVPAEYVGVWHTQEGDPFGEHTISIESDFTVTVDGAPAELRFTVVETPDQTGGESTFDTVAKLTWDGEDYTIAVDESYGFNVLTMDHDGNKYFVKEGAVSDVTFDLYLGTWTGDGYTVVITEDGITINDAPAFVYGKSGPYYRFLYAGARFNLSKDYFSDNLVLQDAGYHEFKLAPEGAEELQIPDTWNGTWVGEDNKGVSYKLVIDNAATDAFIKIYVDNGMEMYGLDLHLEEQFGTLHAIFDAYVGEEGEDVLFDLGYFDWDDHMLLSWQGGDATLYREGGDEPPADTNGIDPSLYGTWEGTSAIFNVEFKLEISATLIRLSVDGGDPMVGEVTGFVGDDPTDFNATFGEDDFEISFDGSQITIFCETTPMGQGRLTRTGDFGGGEQPPVAEVTIPAKFHGTFHGTDSSSNDEYTVEITEHGVSIGKNSDALTAATVTEFSSFEEIYFVWNGMDGAIGAADGGDPLAKISLMLDDVYAPCSRVSGGDEPVEPTVTIPGAFHGEWHGENEGTTYDVVVTEHTITVSIDGEAPLTAKNLNLSDESDAGVSDVYFSLDDGNYFGWTLSVNSQSKVTLSKNGPGRFDVELTKDGGDEPPTPGDAAIEESYWGTEWENYPDRDFTLAVSDDGKTVTINDVSFTVTEVVDYMGVSIYFVTDGEIEYNVEFIDDIYVYVEDSNYEIFNGDLIPADAQEVAVNTNLYGTWTGVSDYGTIYTLTIDGGEITVHIEVDDYGVSYSSYVFYGGLDFDTGAYTYFFLVEGALFNVNFYDGEMTLNSIDDVDSAELAPIIEDTYWGTEWKNHPDGDFTLVVSDDGKTVTIKDVQFTVTGFEAYDEEGYSALFCYVTDGETEYELQFLGFYAYVEDTVNDIYLNLIPADAQEVEVDAALDGTWTGMIEYPEYPDANETYAITIADGHVSLHLEAYGEEYDLTCYVYLGEAYSDMDYYAYYFLAGEEGAAYGILFIDGEMTLIAPSGETMLTKDSGSVTPPPTPPTPSVTIGEDLRGNWFAALIDSGAPASRFDITVTESSITVVVDLKEDAPLVAQNLRQDSNTDIYFTLAGFDGEWRMWSFEGAVPKLDNDSYNLGNGVVCKANGGQVEPEFEGVPESAQGNYNVVELGGDAVIGTLEIGNDFVDLKLTDGESGKVTLTAKDVVVSEYNGVRSLVSIAFAIGDAKFEITPNLNAQTTLYLLKWGETEYYTGYMTVGELVDPEAEGPGGGDDTPSDPVPSDYYGTFVGTGEKNTQYTVNISEDGITVQVDGGDAQAATNVTCDQWNQLAFNVGSVECVLRPDKDDVYTVLYFVYGSDAANLTVQGGSQEGDTSVTLEDKFNGVWTAFGDGAAIATLTVEGGKLSIDGTAVTLAEKDASHFTFSHNGVDYTVSMDYLVPVLVLESGETTVYYYIAGNVPETVDSYYEGTWKSVEGSDTEITITVDTAAGTVTINGETVKIIAGADGVFGPIYAFVYNGELYKLNMFFDTVQLNQDIDLEKA